MAERVQLRRSSTPGEVPTSLLPGELAINEADVKLYAGTADGSVIEVTSTLETDLATLLQTVTTQGQTIAAQAQTLTTQGQSINGLNTAVARNPATIDLDMAGHRIKNLPAATTASDPARLDQVGWQRIWPDASLAGVNAAAFSIPAGVIKIRLEWAALTTTGAGPLYVVFSLDNAATWDTTQHYSYAMTDIVGTTVSPVGPAGQYFPLNYNRTGVRTDAGSLEISMIGQGGNTQNTFSGSVLAYTGGAINYIGGQPTNVLFAINSGAFIGGFARLLGWKS